MSECAKCGNTSTAHFCPGPPPVDSYVPDEISADYQRGYDNAVKIHHTNYCCAVCDYHVMPHRRCILR
jgi:hypothetical protein